MSVSSASFQLTAQSGTYAFTISSCDPAISVSFMIGDEPYDPSRLSQSGFLGGRFAAGQTITTFPQPPIPTVWNQNPIKLTVSAVTSDQGEFTGNSAVFYGYYDRPDAEGLGFYLNQAQSQTNFVFGASGIVSAINESAPAIVLG